MSLASGGWSANTGHSAKSRNSLGESHNLLFFRSPATGKAKRPGFRADLWRGGVSSQVGEVKSVFNSPFLLWTLTGTRLSPGARGLNPPSAEPHRLRPRCRGGAQNPFRKGRVFDKLNMLGVALHVKGMLPLPDLC